MSGSAEMRQVGPADRWIGRAAVATVTVLAALAGAVSYSHMRQLAQQHGQAGWHAHAFPLSVDGLEIVASLVLLAGHRSGRRPGWLPWAALVLGAAGSLAANVATAGPGTVGRIIAGWPALALLIAVKLLTGMLNRPAVTVSRPSAAALSGRSTRNCQAVRPRADRSPDIEPRRTAGTASGGDLLPAAQAARDDLHRAGQPLTRDALAARLRQAGHPLRNASVTPLLRELRHERSGHLAASTNNAPPPPVLSPLAP